MGKDGFNWFVGVIEDRNDPDKAGRVKVRCLGYHSENTQDIPTEHLPWAHVMMPVTAGANSGIGLSPPFLLEGTSCQTLSLFILGRVKFLFNMIFIWRN